MKLLHLCVNYSTPLFSLLFKGLSYEIRSQIVFYPRRKKHKFCCENNDKIEVVSPQIINQLTRVFYSFKIYKCLRVIKKKIDLSQITITHAHTLFSDGGQAYLLKKKVGIPYVVSVRQTDFKILKYKPWLKNKGRKVLLGSSRIICISEVLKNQLVKKYDFDENFVNKKVVIIPNGINSEYLNCKIQKHKHLSGAKIKLLYVGSFYKLKNLHKVIEFVRLHQDRYDLTIVGGGGDYELRIKELIRLNSNIINYLGRIENIGDLKRIYKLCDIFIMPSKPETFGLVYIEAMSQGVPVIYSKNAGIDKLFKDGHIGYPVNPLSSLNWQFYIDKIRDNYQEISDNCYREAQKFSWNKSISSILDIYENTRKLSNR